MMLTQVCDGCGESFITRHGSFCADCLVVRITKSKPPTVLKQGNDRNRESKQHNRYKRQRKRQDIH